MNVIYLIFEFNHLYHKCLIFFLIFFEFFKFLIFFKIIVYIIYINFTIVKVLIVNKYYIYIIQYTNKINFYDIHFSISLTLFYLI